MFEEKESLQAASMAETTGLKDDMAEMDTAGLTVLDAEMNELEEEFEDFDDQNRYIVLTSNIEKLASISHAAAVLADEDDEYMGGMIAVLCGQAVVDVADKLIADPLLEKTRAANVEVTVCGFSADLKGVDRDDIPTDVEVVTNGIWYFLRKQQDGYWSLGL